MACFVNEKNVKTYTEVDNDIKEVGEELIFTQIKCYSSSFSFNSPEIKDSLFNSFLLFLKYHSLHEKLTFCFSTNTHLSKSEKLLTKWVADSELKDDQLRLNCINKVKEILIEEVNKRKHKKCATRYVC